MTRSLVPLSLFLIASVTSAADSERSCRTEVGKRMAAVYVRQCLEVSPATHPPCNDQNPCAMIKAEIKRGCEFLKEPQGNAAQAPGFCNRY
jgi:hypothetical protein